MGYPVAYRSGAQPSTRPVTRPVQPGRIIPFPTGRARPPARFTVPVRLPGRAQFGLAPRAARLVAPVAPALRLPALVGARLIPWLGIALLAYDAWRLLNDTREQGFNRAHPVLWGWTPHAPECGGATIRSDLFSWNNCGQNLPIQLNTRSDNTMRFWLWDFQTVWINGNPYPVGGYGFNRSLSVKPGRAFGPRKYAPLAAPVSSPLAPIVQPVHDADAGSFPQPLAPIFTPWLRPSPFHQATHRSYGRGIYRFRGPNPEFRQQIVITPSGGTVYETELDPSAPPTRRPPPRGEKEKKINGPAAMVAFAAFRSLAVYSEVNDFTDVLWKALPRDARTPRRGGRRPNVHQRRMDVFRNFHRINLSAAIPGLIANEIEDRIVGRAYKYAREGALRQSGGHHLWRALQNWDHVADKDWWQFTPEIAHVRRDHREDVRY